MVKTLLSVCLILTGNILFAQNQWNPSGTNIIYYNSGNVGIGTTSPISRLTVVAGAQGDGIWMGGTGTTNFAFLNNMTLGSWNSLTQPGDNMILWKGSAPDGTDAGGLVLAPWSVATSTGLGLRISSSGSVGIGTSNTYSYMLAVNGSAIFTQVVVKTFGNWPDYVFKKEYQLPSLKSVEAYVRTNHHLPDLPSADSVEKNGLDLGSTQAKLLEKIEELTLYTIELQKQVDKLKETNKQQEGLQQQIDELKELIKK